MRLTTNQEDAESREFQSLYLKDELRGGSVEICYNGSYRSLCSASWDNNGASVVCQQLGFSSFGQSCIDRHRIYIVVVQ